MLEGVLVDPWISAFAILISQVTFIFLRTINVIYTAERRLWPAMLSGAGVGITWMISTTIGMDAIMKGEWQPVIAFLIGGLLGTYWGIKKESKKYESGK